MMAQRRWRRARLTGVRIGIFLMHVEEIDRMRRLVAIEYALFNYDMLDKRHLGFPPDARC